MTSTVSSQNAKHAFQLTAERGTAGRAITRHTRAGAAASITAR
jgi:hypothetical protein